MARKKGSPVLSVLYGKTPGKGNGGSNLGGKMVPPLLLVEGEKEKKSCRFLTWLARRKAADPPFTSKERGGKKRELSAYLATR